MVAVAPGVDRIMGIHNNSKEVKLDDGMMNNRQTYREEKCHKKKRTGLA